LSYTRIKQKTPSISGGVHILVFIFYPSSEYKPLWKPRWCLSPASLKRMTDTTQVLPAIVHVVFVFFLSESILFFGSHRGNPH